MTAVVPFTYPLPSSGRAAGWQLRRSRRRAYNQGFNFKAINRLRAQPELLTLGAPVPAETFGALSDQMG